MKSYEITLKKTVVYYQLVTIEDSASEDDAIEEAFDRCDYSNWEFGYDDYDVADIQEL